VIGDSNADEEVCLTEGGEARIERRYLVKPVIVKVAAWVLIWKAPMGLDDSLKCDVLYGYRLGEDSGN